jgi:hypothetical protein
MWQALDCFIAEFIIGPALRKIVSRRHSGMRVFAQARNP